VEANYLMLSSLLKHSRLELIPPIGATALVSHFCAIHPLSFVPFTKWTLAVHLQVIPPWFALAFAITAAIVSFLAARKASTTPQYPHSSVVDSARTDSPIEKSGGAHKEDI
jgi:hypothetical protein